MTRLERWLAMLAASLALTASLVVVGRTDLAPSAHLRVAAGQGDAGLRRVAPASSSSTGGVQASTTGPPTTAAPAASTTPAAPSSTAAPAPDTKRRWPVGVLRLDLVDPSRPTPAAAGQPAQRGRRLPTVVRYPMGAPRGMSFPLVVFAHGYATSPDTYASILDAWAQSGYVVAAPYFPLASSGGPLDEGDVVHQAADLSFVVGTVLARSASPSGGPLAGLVDPARVGAAGHSDGGETVMGMVFNSCCQDSRVRAGIVMSGCECVFPDAGWFRGPAVPILLAQGDHDPINDMSASTQIFAAAPGPRFLLDLVGGGHLEPFTTDAAHLRAFVAVSLDFLDRYLKARPDALARLRNDAAAPGVSLRADGA